MKFATADGSAKAPGDYSSASGTLTFAPGETSKTITVSVVGDDAIEPDETLTVTLSRPVQRDDRERHGDGDDQERRHAGARRGRPVPRCDSERRLRVPDGAAESDGYGVQGQQRDGALQRADSGSPAGSTGATTSSGSDRTRALPHRATGAAPTSRAMPSGRSGMPRWTASSVATACRERSSSRTS